MEKELTIVFGSQMGTTERFAHELEQEAAGRGIKTRITDGSAFSADDLDKCGGMVSVLSSTFGEGTPPDNMVLFFESLREAKGKKSLGNLHFAVFGAGNSGYGENFNAVGRELDENLGSLGGQRVVPFVAADEASDLEVSFQEWKDKVLGAF